MNLFIQNKLSLLGTEEDISNLARKESAKILVISDSHGKVETLKDILKKFGSKVDAFVFCGDGCEDVGVLTNYSCLPKVIAMIHGNNDESEMNIELKNDSGKQTKVIKVPAAVTFNAANTNVLVTHGHIFGVHFGVAGLENHSNNTGASLILYGHTHVAKITESNGKTFINPGSCALPRRGLPPSFAIVELSQGKKPYCTFYEIKFSLSNGFEFVPFNPEVRE